MAAYWAGSCIHQHGALQCYVLVKYDRQVSVVVRVCYNNRGHNTGEGWIVRREAGYCWIYSLELSAADQKRLRCMPTAAKRKTREIQICRVRAKSTEMQSTRGTLHPHTTPCWYYARNAAVVLLLCYYLYYYAYYSCTTVVEYQQNTSMICICAI